MLRQTILFLLADHFSVKIFNAGMNYLLYSVFSQFSGGIFTYTRVSLVWNTTQTPFTTSFEILTKEHFPMYSPLLAQGVQNPYGQSLN